MVMVKAQKHSADVSIRVSEPEQWHLLWLRVMSNCCWSELIAVISQSLEQHQPEPAAACRCYPTLFQHWFL